jgi:4-hydroxyphenylpyruvate dioxygenase
MKAPVEAVCLSGGLDEKPPAIRAAGFTGVEILENDLSSCNGTTTDAWRFLSALFGSGVRPVAFRTDDIFATVARSRDNGVPPLNIPESRHDDLDARIGMSVGQLDRPRSLNISATVTGVRSTSGSMPTPPTTGFFLNVVRRRNDAGFGAPNASIRPVARTRLTPIAD